MISNNVLTIKSSYFTLINDFSDNKDIESLLSFIALFEEKQDDFLYGTIYSYTDYIVNKSQNVSDLDLLHNFFIKLCNISRIGKQLGDYALAKIKICKDKCINIDSKNINNVVITSPYFKVKCNYKNNLFLAKKCDLLSEKLAIMNGDFNDAINTFYSALGECKTLDDISILKNHICLLSQVDDKGSRLKELVYDRISLDSSQSIRQNVATSSEDVFKTYYDEYIKLISGSYDENDANNLISKFLSIKDETKKDNINNIISHLNALKADMSPVSMISNF